MDSLPEDTFFKPRLQSVEIKGPGALIHGSSLPGFRLQVTCRKREEFPPHRPGMEPKRIMGEIVAWVVEGQEELWLWRQGLTLSLDFHKKEGEAHLAEARDWHNVLRITYFHLLLEQQGLLLHASGIVHGGDAYVFPGLSGAGKTTIVKHSPGMIVLSDEMVAVQLSSKGTPTMAFGTPFFGDWGKPGEKIVAPLKGLFFPCKAKKNRLVPLSPRETLTRLLPCVFTYTKCRPRLDKLFDLTAELAGRLPGFALHFRPGQDFWKVIDGD